MAALHEDASYAAGLALYNALTGRAWIYTEELDVDILVSEAGVAYLLEWIQTRFMEVELSKISQMMGELFRGCRRKQEHRTSRSWKTASLCSRRGARTERRAGSW